MTEFLGFPGFDPHASLGPFSLSLPLPPSTMVLEAKGMDVSIDRVPDGDGDHEMTLSCWNRPIKDEEKIADSTPFTVTMDFGNMLNRLGFCRHGSGKHCHCKHDPNNFIDKVKNGACPILALIMKENVRVVLVAKLVQIADMRTSVDFARVVTKLLIKNGIDVTRIAICVTDSRQDAEADDNLMMKFRCIFDAKKLIEVSNDHYRSFWARGVTFAVYQCIDFIVHVPALSGNIVDLDTFMVDGFGKDVGIQPWDRLFTMASGTVCEIGTGFSNPAPVKKLFVEDQHYDGFEIVFA